MIIDYEEYKGNRYIGVYGLRTMAHSRSATIEVGRLTDTNECDGCGIEDVIVMGVDTSDGEYGQIFLCEACITMLFAEAKKHIEV